MERLTSLQIQQSENFRMLQVIQMNEMVVLLDQMDPMDEHEETNYTYNGYPVPRVTKILQKCIHSDALMYWANSLGFKRQSYNKTLATASEIGSQCHNNIDEYLEDDTHEPPDNMMYQSRNAYESFLKWFNDINSLFYLRSFSFHNNLILVLLFS